MLYEEIEIQFIRDRARTPGHLSVPCFSLSTFTCFPAAGEILTFSFIDRESVWSAKTGSKAPSRRQGGIRKPWSVEPWPTMHLLFTAFPESMETVIWELEVYLWKGLVQLLYHIFHHILLWHLVQYCDPICTREEAKLVACYDMATWLWFRCKIHCDNIESNIIPQTYSSPLLDSLWFIFKFFLNSPAAILHIWFFFRDEPIIYESKLIYESSLTSL